MPTFGDRLKELRINRKLTQKQLATIFEVTERGYQNYELDKSTPHYDTLIKLAEYFNVSVDYLMGRTDNPQINK